MIYLNLPADCHITVRAQQPRFSDHRSMAGPSRPHVSGMIDHSRGPSIINVNRSDLIDSPNAFDIWAALRKSWLMIDTHEPLVFQAMRRCEPDRNIARYYTLSIEHTLLGDHALVRQWGRIVCRGQIKIDLYATRSEAERAFQRLAAAKRRRHYR